MKTEITSTNAERRVPVNRPLTPALSSSAGERETPSPDRFREAGREVFRGDLSGEPPLAPDQTDRRLEPGAGAGSPIAQASEPPLQQSSAPESHPSRVPSFRFPSSDPWPEPVDGGGLLDELAGVLTRFVVLPKWAAETLALWTLHTYAFQLRDVTTYLGVESPEKRCGNTACLTAVSELASRPVPAANISPSAFFRVIEESQPTLLIDEADTFLQSNDQLRGILNSGYTRKTSFVLRVGNQSPHLPPDGPSLRPASTAAGVAGDGAPQVTRFSCWCPKVMAAIGRLPDTLADRCIVIRMQRKTATEQCERLRSLEPTRFRRQCARFVSDHAGAIASARPEIPASLNDRAADIWEPLLVLADLAGGNWPEAARRAAVSLTASAQEHNPIGSLLLDIFVVFTLEQADRLFSRALAEGLGRFGDHSWAEMLNGKAITGTWLAQQLRPYGIRPKTLWIGDTSAKGYTFEDLQEVFQRYIPRCEVE